METIDLKCPGDCPPTLPSCLFYVHPILNNKFYMCIDDQAKSLTCPEGSIFFPEREECDLPGMKNGSQQPENDVLAKKVKHNRRSMNNFDVRRPFMNFHKQLNNRLKSLEERVTALENILQTSTAAPTTDATVSTFLPALNVNNEILEQIGASINSDKNITGKQKVFYWESNFVDKFHDKREGLRRIMMM